MHDDDDFYPGAPDWPVGLVPGQLVLLQLREEGGKPIRMVFHAIEKCGVEYDDNIPGGAPAEPHVFTICEDCIDSWGCDYYITELDTPASLGFLDKI